MLHVSRETVPQTWDTLRFHVKPYPKPHKSSSTSPMSVVLLAFLGRFNGKNYSHC